MKVARVEAIPVAYPEPNDHSRKRSVCLVRITSTDGAVGWGECCSYFPEASRAAKALVDGMAELVVGESVLATHRVWYAIRHHSWWYGNGAGLASIALSGIDMALWDLKGKTLGARVLDLLGGPVNDRMPAVASLHATEADIDRMVEGMARHLEGGLQGIKVGFGKKGDAHLGFDHDRDVRFVRALRAAVGPTKRIMIDLGIKNFWDVPTAIRRARAFEEFDVHWLEEPLGDRDPKGYAALRAGTSLRLAYGEKEWNYRGVQEIVESGTVDVIGLDPGRIEGITGFWKAAEICVAHRRQANAHNFSTAIVSAASQALSFASPAARELELQPVYGPAQADLVDRPVWHTDGWINPPEGPGLGIIVNEDLVRSARLDQ